MHKFKSSILNNLIAIKLKKSYSKKVVTFYTNFYGLYYLTCTNNTRHCFNTNNFSLYLRIQSRYTVSINVLRLVRLLCIQENQNHSSSIWTTIKFLTFIMNVSKQDIVDIKTLKAIFKTNPLVI